jgi:O-succinylbenzoic acid--CoA ligase
MPPRHLLALDAPDGAAETAGLLPRLRAALDGSGPALMLLPRGPEPLREALLAAARPDLPLEQDDVALVAPTSGSTGTPRLAMLTADALAASASATADLLGGAGGYALALPSSYVAGLMVLVRSVLGGHDPVAVDLSAGFTPDAFADAVATLLRRDDAPRYTSLVPTQLSRLLDAGGSATAALVALDAVLLGGAAAPPALLQRARAAGVSVVTTYGMTETCGGCVYDGVPLPGTRVAVDDGRVRLTGPTLFSGYRGRPDLSAQALVDGWFVTSDLGRLDAAGRLEVLGRADDVIVTGGVKVSPTPVELALASHPAVAEVVVVGRPDPGWGERVVAVVAPAPGEEPDLAGLREHARLALDAAWLPRDLVVVDAVPHLPSGKPDRPAVRTLVAAPTA